MVDLIELLKEASHPRAAIQPRTDSLALAVAARAAQGRAWMQKCDAALRSIQVRSRCQRRTLCMYRVGLQHVCEPGQRFRIRAFLLCVQADVFNTA